MDKVSIREAVEGDAQSTCDLLNSVIEEGRYTIMVDPFEPDKQAAWIRDLKGKGTCYVAVLDNGSVVGIQTIEPLSTARSLRHIGDISTFVVPSALRMGLG